MGLYHLTEVYDKAGTIRQNFEYQDTVKYSARVLVWNKLDTQTLWLLELQVIW
jgi:hypothetical protein